MTDGIEMDVIHVPLKVLFIPNCVLMEAALPYRRIAVLDA